MFNALTYRDVLSILDVILGLSILLCLLIIYQKYKLKARIKKDFYIQTQLAEKVIFNKENNFKCKSSYFMKAFFEISQKFQISQSQLDYIYNCLYKRKYIQKLIKNVGSSNEFRKIKAITYLSLFKRDNIKTVLCEQLKVEQKDHIRILIVNGLKYNIDDYSLRCIITSLLNSRRYYQSRVIKIISKYVDQSKYDLSIQLNSPLLEVREAFVEVALEVYHPNFEKPLLNTLKEIEEHFLKNNSILLKNASEFRIKRLYYQTLKVLSLYYSFNLSDIKYMSHIDDEVVKIAIDSLIKNGDLKTINYILKYASSTKRDYIYSEGIYEICEKNKNYYKDIFEILKTNENMRIKQLIAGVLSKKIDYLILTVKEENDFNNLISFMIKSRYSINIINWLNYNKNKDLQNKLLKIIKPIAEDNYDFYLELNNYLRRDIFQEMGFVYSFVPRMDRPSTDPEIKKTRWLTLFLFISLLSLPVVFILLNLKLIGNESFFNIITKYIVNLNGLFVIYYLIVNFIYLSFAFISLFEFNSQERLWNIKDDDFLYEDGIISPISILVPAYNEELNITESVKSLLSLKYPIYEVIVINDGSKDNTLQELIKDFELKRVDYVYKKDIPTMPVKAVYKNKFYSKLTVIDKENGGKADALNLGINFSKYEYVCGIDADSIIEPNGLLRMMSTVLDHDSITLALGGSIVPVNGAIVDHGVVDEYNLPSSVLAKFQTIEYIRAFNAGRLGFTKLKCFLIVSGAFGLFEKRMLKDIGGYLTASSMRKDTVGEDMELVVRIVEKASDNNLKYRIQYVPMARCYTEVPEDRKSFLNQRNRWQKGLIDTLSYHRKMIFNRKYKSNGTIALPYFFLFEMLGPVMEIQIYLTIIIGLFFGIFDGVLLLLLFGVTVILGIFVTLISIFVQEKYTEPFSIKDTLKILFYSIIENFGWRQFISLYRSFGYLSSFKGKHNWGTINRKGYKNK